MMPEFLERRFNSKCHWYLITVSLLAYFTKISAHLFLGCDSHALRARMRFLLVLATGIYTWLAV
jgi:hypothetical protein